MNIDIVPCPAYRQSITYAGYDVWVISHLRGNKMAGDLQTMLLKGQGRNGSKPLTGSVWCGGVIFKDKLWQQFYSL